MKEFIINEETLIKHCIDNRRSAQESLYNQYYQQLYVIAMRYLGDYHDTEDAIILTFTKVFKSLQSFQFQGQGSLGKWIRTILIRESIRILNKRKQLNFDADIKYVNTPSSNANSLEQMQAEDIMKMIDQLPTGYRTIFNLYVIEGYTHREIASMLNISENTSKTQLKKARTNLMTQINKEKIYGNI